MTDMNSNGSAPLSYPFAGEGQASNDEELLAAVLNALHHNTGIPSDLIRAQVQHGRVTLSGVVAQDYERALAEKEAATPPGVIDVTNNIVLES